MAPVVEKIKVIPKKELGEGPHWDDKNQILYFVDIYNAIIGEYVPNGEIYDEIKIGEEPVGFVIPVKGEANTFVCGIRQDLRLIKIDMKAKKVVRSETLVTVPDTDSTRINDGKCDPSGRVWFGTMNDSKTEFTEYVGSLYSFSMKEGLKKHQENITISNGLAWSTDGGKMFYIDSGKRRVEQYEFDIKAGKLGAMNVAFDFKQLDDSSLPDGMTIDEDGNLWVACFRGSQVINVNPKTQKLVSTVKIPLSRQITSVCFGGSKLNELFVTSASMLFENDPIPEDAGRTFRISNLGVSGRPAAEFDTTR